MKSHLKFILLCGIMASSFTSFSQKKKKKGDATDVFKITFLNPGVSYEKRIGKFQTLYGQAFMNLSAVHYGSYYSGSSSTTFFFDPALTLQYRYYYNFTARSDKRRRTEMNSLNYLAPVYEAIFSKMPIDPAKIGATDNRRPISRLGLVWGIQRNYSGRFSLDLNLGYGIMFANSKYDNGLGGTNSIKQSMGCLMGQLNLGFWLSKEKK
jgi:hypothetical protein